MLYDYIAKFETELFVYPFSPEISNMLSVMNIDLPFTKSMINTKMAVTVGPLIPESKVDDFCKVQTEQYKKAIENKSCWNKLGKVVKVGKTKFTGYESVFEHKGE